MLNVLFGLTIIVVSKKNLEFIKLIEKNMLLLKEASLICKLIPIEELQSRFADDIQIMQEIEDIIGE